MLSVSLAHALDVKDYAVRVSAQVQVSPPKITLSWPAIADTPPSQFRIFRKLAGTNTFSSTPTTNLTGASFANTFVDTNVLVGQVYEYKIDMGSGNNQTNRFGHIMTAINAPLVEDRGKVILIVDNRFTNSLAVEISRLTQDLVGDGWTVLRHSVNTNDSVPSVKALIVADYLADSNHVKSLFLLGHVPVPYSGSINPDGHPEHVGAWPADGYYGDMDGNWTDSTTNNLSNVGTARNTLTNVPGDGKFDQSTFPSTGGGIELQVGRVDLTRMIFHPLSETELLRQYLNKDHNFRSGLVDVERRGLIYDNIGDAFTEGIPGTSWRNLAPLFGAANTFTTGYGNVVPTLDTDSYMVTWAFAFGAFNNSDGFAISSDFVNNDIKTVFISSFGSYYGDWDADDDFLRATLTAPTYTLGAMFGARPTQFYYPLALGETIGFCCRRTQNNFLSMALFPTKTVSTTLSFAGQIHIGLMGDPTIRMHPVKMPASPAWNPLTSNLIWQASADTILGYHVYRATNAAGPFTRLTTSVVSGTNFIDAAPLVSSVYMVRAIKLESSASGTYTNASQGVFVNAVTPPAWFTAATFPSPSQAQLTISGTPGAKFELQYTTNLVNWPTLATLTNVTGTLLYLDNTVLGISNRFYRLFFP